MSQQIPHIYISDSNLHGIGVFTGVEILQGSIIEICPVIRLPKKDINHIKKTILYNYYFEWGDDLLEGGLALGYGSIYNHSFEPNAYYDIDMQADTLSIYAFRDILPQEEITINYNGQPDDDTELWFEAR